MAIFNSYVSLPEGMYFDKPENHESSSICHETGGSEMIEAIWALPGSPGSLRHEHPEVVGLGSQRPLRILAFELVPLVPKKNAGHMQETWLAQTLFCFFSITLAMSS